MHKRHNALPKLFIKMDNKRYLQLYTIIHKIRCVHLLYRMYRCIIALYLLVQGKFFYLKTSIFFCKAFATQTRGCLKKVSLESFAYMLIILTISVVKCKLLNKTTSAIVSKLIFSRSCQSG